MADRLITTSNGWAVGADNLQWILYRQYESEAKFPWRAISFVRTQRSILERCMREKGCPQSVRAILLAGLPDTFDQWHKTHHGRSLRVSMAPE